MSIDVVVNGVRNAIVMLDYGCCTYLVVCDKLVRQLNLPRYTILSTLLAIVDKKTSPVQGVTEFVLDIGEVKRKVAAYIILSTYEFDMILRKT